jgi:hypothetical protein
MSLETPSRKIPSRRPYLIAGAICIILLLCGPYAITSISQKSICVSELRMIGGQERISKSLEFLRQRHLPYYSGPDCCTVGKGTSSFVPLGISAYLLHGKTHYVFIPKYESSRIVNGKYNAANWHIITTNTCGNPTNIGLDL